MMRIVLAAGVFIAALSFDARPVKATEGPWCAFISLGTGGVYEDCQYRSFEECRPNVLAGNRGFCNPNPRWVDGPARGRRHAQRH
jgi:Protein of unknown function (DUF3551)